VAPFSSNSPASKRLAMMLAGNGGAIDLNYHFCSAQITTPVAAPVTIPTGQVYCSSGAIVINDTVTINGAWRLT
jgi:hypothetical protein